jgi:hypothetical protein
MTFHVADTIDQVLAFALEPIPEGSHKGVGQRPREGATAGA